MKKSVPLSEVVARIPDGAWTGPKIVRQCRLPITSRRVDLAVTELAVIRPTSRGLQLVETPDGVSIDEVIAATQARLHVDGVD